MKRTLLVSGKLAAVLILATHALFAQVPDLPGSGTSVAPADLVTLRVEIESAGSAVGDDVAGVAIVTISDGWHINSVEPLDEFTIPTRLEIESAAVGEVSVEFPPHKEMPFEFAGGSVLAVYDGTIEIPFRTKRLAEGAPGVDANLYFQACNNQLCLPPRSVSVRVALSESATSSGASAGESAAPAASGFTPLAAAPPDAGSGAGLFSGDLGSTFRSRGLLLTLVVVFVLGLALNLTPCVYPLIPITVGYFSTQKKGSRAGQILLSACYVLGIAVTYSVLGVFSALSGSLFGAWLQSSSVLVFFAVLMLVLAASMFGLFDIQPPRFIAQRAGAKGGYVGALSMGLLAGVVAAPCVGPFVISLIALVAQLHDVTIGFLLFFVLALGLGVPFLVLGVFSTAANSIPRSGPWLVQVKKAFGFILIGMAFYFLRPVAGDVIYRWGIALSLLVGSAFLLFGKSRGSSGKAIRFTMAAALLAGGIFFAIPPRDTDGVEWKAYSASAIQDAKYTGQPVVIDFYADWCLPCKELDNLTFSDPAVVAEADRFVRLKADLTRPEDPATRELTERYGILGVPTIVLIDSKGEEVTESRLVGFEKAAPFVERLARVR